MDSSPNNSGSCNLLMTNKLFDCLSDEESTLFSTLSRFMNMKSLRSIIEEYSITLNNIGHFPSKIAISPDCYEYLQYGLKKYNVQFTPEEQIVIDQFFSQYYQDRQDIELFADIMDKYSANNPQLAHMLNMIFAVDGFGQHFHYKYYLDHLQYTHDVGLDDKIYDDKFLHISAVRHIYDTLKVNVTPLKIHESLLGFLNPSKRGNYIMEMYVEFVQKHHGLNITLRKQLELKEVLSLIEKRVQEDKKVDETGKETSKEVDETGKETSKVDETGKETSKVDETGKETSKVDETGKETSKEVDETGKETSKEVDETGKETSKEVDETEKIFISKNNIWRLQNVESNIESFMENQYIEKNKLLEILANLEKRGVDIDELLAIDGFTGNIAIGPNFEYKYYIHNLSIALEDDLREDSNVPKMIYIQMVRYLYKKLSNVDQRSKQVYKVLREAMKDVISLPPLNEKLKEIFPTIQTLREWCRSKISKTVLWKVVENIGWVEKVENIEFISADNVKRFKNVESDIESFMENQYIEKNKLLEILSNLEKRGVDIDELLAIDGFTGNMAIGPSFEYKYYIHNLGIGFEDFPRDVPYDPYILHVETIRHFYNMFKGKTLKYQIKQSKQMYNVLKEVMKDFISLPPLDEKLEEILVPEIQGFRDYYKWKISNPVLKKLVENIGWVEKVENLEVREIPFIFISADNVERLKNVERDIESFMENQYIEKYRLLELFSNLEKRGVDIDELLAIDGLTGNMVSGPNFEYKYYIYNLSTGPKDILFDLSIRFSLSSDTKPVHMQAIRDIYRILKGHVTQRSKHVYNVLREAMKDVISLPPLDEKLEEILAPEIQSLCESTYTSQVSYSEQIKLVENLVWRVEKVEGI